MNKLMLNLNEISAGMVVAEPVLTASKQIVLQPGVELTSHMVNVLHKWKVKSVCVKSESKVEASHRFIADTGRANFDDRYNHAVQEAKSIFDYMRTNEQLPHTAFYRLSYDSLYDLIYKKNVLNHLYRLKSPLDYTYIHAIDVGIIAGLIGFWSGFEKEEIQKLILAGLMHDIGKSQIPRSILEKPTLLNSEQMDMCKLHPSYGYYMSKSILGIASEIGKGIFQHHERENGSGYPNGLQGHQIHPFAKIIAIADVYDALTSNRVYKKSVTPFEALNILGKQIITYLDQKYCEIFIKNVSKSLIGSIVLLSDQSQAKVIEYNAFQFKPVLQKKEGQLVGLNECLSFIEDIVKFPQ